MKEIFQRNKKVRKMSVDFLGEVWYCGVLRKEVDKHGTKETAHKWKTFTITMKYSNLPHNLNGIFCSIYLSNQQVNYASFVINGKLLPL